MATIIAYSTVKDFFTSLVVPRDPAEATKVAWHQETQTHA